jgi:hypothetical protein
MLSLVILSPYIPPILPPPKETNWLQHGCLTRTTKDRGRERQTFGSIPNTCNVCSTHPVAHSYSLFSSSRLLAFQGSISL